MLRVSGLGKMNKYSSYFYFFKFIWKLQLTYSIALVSGVKHKD